MAQRITDIALILGAMKAGTTSLFEYLAQHPQVARARIKEPGFFALDDAWSRGLDWYFGLWDFEPQRHRVALEASTDYTKRPYLPCVARKIASVRGVRFRFIYVMRHPVRRIESQAHHAALVGAELGYMFERYRDFSLDRGISERGIMFSRYAYQLDPFVRQFGADSILLLTAEDLKRSPRTVVDRVCRFLGLDAFEPNVQAMHHSRADSKVPPPLWSALARAGALRRMAHRIVDPQRRDALRRRVSREVPGRFSVTPEEERMLLNVLMPDLQRLRAQYGVDVEAQWGITLRPQCVDLVPEPLRPVLFTG